MMNEKLYLDVVECTNNAMLYELCTYPSFGLVSPYSKGAHLDMDHFTFIDSSSVLNKYMYQFAKLGDYEGCIVDLLNEAIHIGKSCEDEMFLKTKGINTHKGLIFVLGTLVISTVHAIRNKHTFQSIFDSCSQLTKTKLNELKYLDKNTLSNGEQVYVRYQKEGVRKEAYLGFPIIQEALNIIDLNDKGTLVKTLVYIMSRCEDTTILHRKGLEGLTYVQSTMKRLIAREYDKNMIEEVNQRFIEEGISPGGAADLLCGTIFLSLMKDRIFLKDKKD